MGGQYKKTFAQGWLSLISWLWFLSVDVTKNLTPHPLAVDKKSHTQSEITASNGNLLSPPCVYPGDMYRWAAACFDSITLSFPFKLYLNIFLFCLPTVWTVQGRNVKVKSDDQEQVEISVEAGRVTLLL